MSKYALFLLSRHSQTTERIVIKYTKFLIPSGMWNIILFAKLINDKLNMEILCPRLKSNALNRYILIATTTILSMLYWYGQLQPFANSECVTFWTFKEFEFSWTWYLYAFGLIFIGVLISYMQSILNLLVILFKIS